MNVDPSLRAIASVHPSMMRIGFIGVGKLGLPCAEVMAQHHYVEAFDCVAVRPGNFSMVNSLGEVCADKDVIFVAVPTPHDDAYGGEVPSAHLPPQDFSYDAVKHVLREINVYTTPQQLVALISTVLPGTTRRELIPLVRNYRLVYNPYLIAIGTVRWDMVNPEMVIVGTEDGGMTNDARRLMDLYGGLVQNTPRFVVGTWEEAESIKIFYNTFISAKISLVNMIQDVAERLGHMKADVVTDALRFSTLRIASSAYMTPGMGDGGPCHPRDNIALRWLSEELGLGYDLFGAIAQSREAQARSLACTLARLAEQYSLPQIYIHGKTYKPNVACTAGSYSLLVAHFVTALNYEVHFIDPLTGDTPRRVHGVVLLAHNSSVSFRNSTVPMKQPLYCEVTPGSVIVDPWRVVSGEMFPGCTIVHYGDTRTANRVSVADK